MVCYNPLWKTLIDKGINKTKLKEMLGCSSATISSMTNNKYVS